MKKSSLCIMSMITVIAMSTTTYAGQWKLNPDTSQDAYYNDDGSLANGWQWTDGDEDGIAECYYFDKYGVPETASEYIPDGYTVDNWGRWTVDGVIQKKAVGEIREIHPEGTYYLLVPSEDYTKQIPNSHCQLKVAKNEDGSYSMRYIVDGEEIYNHRCETTGGARNGTEYIYVTEGGSTAIYQYGINTRTGQMEIFYSDAWEVDYYVKVE